MQSTKKTSSVLGKNTWVLAKDKHLQSPSGIISSWLFEAENTSKLPNFPTPEGIPSKSNLLSLRYNLHKAANLHSEAGSAVSWLSQRFKTSKLVHISESKIIQG